VAVQSSKRGSGEPDGPPIAIVGVTASGKSALALELARRLDGIELVSVDSMQVYRGMDIGTAKPSAAERAEVRHHLIDMVEPSDLYTVSRFQTDFRAAMADIERRGRRAVLVGGTGLYLRAAIDGLDIPGQYPVVVAELDAEPDTIMLHRRLVALDPVAASRMEPTNRRRVIRALEVTLGSGRLFSDYGPGLDAYPPTRYIVVGPRLERSVIYARIERRYRAQVAAGFVEEVARLAGAPGGLSRNARQALGYRELLRHVEQGAPLEDCVSEAMVRTRRFARRQERWFRRDPRVRWFDDPDNPMAVLDPLLRHLE